MKRLIITLAIILILSPVVILGIGLSEEVIGETPCVDGRNRINLEGIMCEKSEVTLFGENPLFGLFLFIFVFFGFIVFHKGLNMEELK